MADQPVTIGRIVHYVLAEGRNPGEHRPAFVVKTWGDTPDSSVQLQVFTDAGNDGLDPVLWATSVHHSETPEPRTWHWPERH